MPSRCVRQLTVSDLARAQLSGARGGVALHQP